MPLVFDFDKTIQAVGVLLRQAGPTQTANYMRLLKLLYIADRESIRETGRSITGDRVVAMARGPVLSHVLDLIKDQDARSSQWRQFIQTRDYHICLVSDPGNDQLCRYEVDKLREVWDRYRGKDEWDMVQVTHEFSEWMKNDPSPLLSRPIPLADIVEAVGRKDDLDKIEKTTAESAAFDRMFGG